MEEKNIVYVARSLDGYIAGKNGELDWLQSVPDPENVLGVEFPKFMDKIDAIVMGKNTFQTVCSFEGEWPYNKPIFVLSTTLKFITHRYKSKASLVKGTIPEILDLIHKKGYKRLYIDGGATIQGFLKEDLIDELIITTMPILLGGGTPLFRELPESLKLEHLGSRVLLNQIVQDSYKRKRYS